MIEQRLMDSPRVVKDVFRELFDIAVDRTKHGANYLLRLASVNPFRRHKRRQGFHGHVLRQISEQVWVLQPDGTRVRYTKTAWKEYFRNQYIPPIPQEYTVKATGEVKVRMVKRSTEDLDDDEFDEFVLQVEAEAVVDWGVVFEEEEDETFGTRGHLK